MSDDNIESAAIFTAKNKNGHTVTLHAWFVNKLGATMGDRMFKELVTFVEESVKSLPGNSGVMFDTRDGRIVSVQNLN